ncbi:DNA polymerase III subunit delta' [Lusitaniella coriacea]|uniref:DNA polymerase III subunit delta' n=1 Tax=Lusitaniella coriacea TaxID=1983105 RepID=UPI003CED7552
MFAPLLGQPQAVELLQQAVRQNRIAPAYLFVGSPGIGRQLAAKAFSLLLLGQGIPEKWHAPLQQRLQAGNHPDFLWVQPTYLHQGKRLTVAEAAAAGIERRGAPQIRIEQIREIAQFLSRPPLEAPRAVVAIEEAQTMAEGAANALLKTLEEPGRATLILIAPRTDSLLPTLVSRCQSIPFYPLALEQMRQVLEQEGYAEILDYPEICAIAQGSPGEAIRAWQQYQKISPELLAQLTQPPPNTYRALELAKEINKTLEIENQLWLLDYLQYSYWQQFLKGKISHSPLRQLEQARQSLLCYAQPRLVWEVVLLGLTGSIPFQAIS